MIMRRLLSVVLVPLFALIASFSGTALMASVNSIGPAPSMRFTALPLTSASRSLDFKKQELPKKFPSAPKARTVPNLEPLIDQLIRHADLNSSATKLMPWVYTTTSETVVADYEAAVTRLDVANHCLQEAMGNVLSEQNSLELDPSLVHATIELDNAEFTILLLVEIAKLEL